MQAKEMFEELGFKQEANDRFITYKLGGNGIYEGISFDMEYKTCFTYTDEYVFDIDAKILKAVNKQFEELGWIGK